MTSHTIRPAHGSGRPPVALALACSALILAGILIGGCSEPLTPMLPEWEVDAHLPLINQTYTMTDLLREDDMLRITQNGDQLMIVTQRHPLRAFSLADHLRIDNTQFRISERLDVVRFDIPDYLDQGLTVFTLFPALQSGRQALPAMRSELGLGVDIDARSYFEEMTFEKGVLSLNFLNMTPVPLRIEQIRLLNAQGASITSVSPNAVVQAGQVMTMPALNLANLTLTSMMRLGFDISTPGSGGAMVDLSTSSYLGIKGEIRNSDILSVKGYVPSQELTFNEQVDLAGNSGMRINHATVQAGSLDFSITNHFNLSAEVEITLQGASIGGQAIRASTTVAAKSNKTLSIDLAGAELAPKNESTLLYDARIVTEDASSKAVLLKRHDSVSVIGAVNNVSLARMTGRLSPRTLHIRRMERSHIGADKQITGSLNLTEASMWALLRNQAVLPMGIVQASVLGKSAKGSSSSLNVQPRGIAGNSETLIRFDDGQALAFLNSFSPQLPDSMGLEGTFTLNPDGQYGSAAASDSLTGDLYVEFPLRFTQVHGSVMDTVEMFIDEESRKKLAEVNEGVLRFEIENHLPTSVSVEAEFLDSRYRPLLTPRSSDGSLLQAKAAIIGNDGFASRSVVETLQLRFSGEDFAALSRAAWIRFTLSFNTDPNSGAAFRNTDYVRVRGYTRLNVRSTMVTK